MGERKVHRLDALKILRVHDVLPTGQIATLEAEKTLECLDHRIQKR